MSSKSLLLDHNLMLQLWADIYFWECVPAFEEYREVAEIEVEAAIADQSGLNIKNCDLYNQLIKMIEEWTETDPAKVCQLTDYIHKKRKYRREDIVMPSVITVDKMIQISDGVGTCRGGLN